MFGRTNIRPVKNGLKACQDCHGEHDQPGQDCHGEPDQPIQDCHREHEVCHNLPRSDSARERRIALHKRDQQP